MKKILTAAVAAIALAGVLMIGVTAASATPGKSTRCVNCHDASSAVHVTVTKTSSTSTTVTYKVSVTGGKGVAGWGVFSGTKNVAHRLASTGTFKIAKGKAIRVYGVKKGSGSALKSFTTK